MSRRKKKQATQDMSGWYHPVDTEEQRRARDAWFARQAENKRKRDESRRALFTAFEMWTICEHKTCRRGKSCCGDTDECLVKRWYPTVPDEVRTYISKVAHFVAKQGMTVEQACDATEADLKERAEIMARYEARQAAQPHTPGGGQSA